MSIKHHLDDATIMSFAAGILPLPLSIVVSSHLNCCTKCRERVRNAELIGSIVVDDCDAKSLSPGAVNNLLERLESETRTKETVSLRAEQTSRCRTSLLPSKIQALIGGAETDVEWKRVAKGVDLHMIDLGASDTGKLYLLKIAPGRVLPEHGHGGSELTLVLAGSYTDEIGQFEAGDIADLDHDVEHQPIVDAGQPCLCLVASEEPAQFRGVLPRIVQPFIGI